MPRAIETAEIIAPALGGLDVRPECDFCEGHPGEADGLTWAELDERYPPSGWTPTRDEPRAGRPGGRWASGSACALASLVERHPGETVRGGLPRGVIVHVMLHFLALDDSATERAWISPDNTSLTEWRFAPNPYRKGTLPVELVRFNDVAHLGTRSEP